MGKNAMHFLLLKPWHPSNKWNQKKIWVAEQKKLHQDRREKEARAELKRETRRLADRRSAAAKGDLGAAKEAQQQQMKFLYAPPPGYMKTQEKESDQQEDEAVKAFKRSLIRRDKNFSGATISNLERQVGRREKKGLTLGEMVERHPELANAPVEGDYAQNVKLNFKPFNKTLRNCRCMRCGEWGHRSGDRECKMRNFNPHDEARRNLEDPMAFMAAAAGSEKQRLVLKRSLVTGASGGTMSGGKEYKLLSDSDDPDDIEREFIAQLSTKDKKALLRKMMGKDQSADDHSDSDSDSDSSDSSRKKKKKKNKKKNKKAEKKKKRKRKREGDKKRKKDKKKHKKKRSRTETDNSVAL